MKIAFATSDGETINEHFGKATSFLIYEIGKEGWSYVDKRNVTPLSCDDKHTEETLAPTIEAFKDCTAVIAVKVGGAVKRTLEISGISVFEREDSIDNALSKLAAYYTKTGGVRNEDTSALTPILG
jgi:predicted Fe-Mo cluster-binding NifX family protein